MKLLDVNLLNDSIPLSIYQIDNESLVVNFLQPTVIFGDFYGSLVIIRAKCRYLLLNKFVHKNLQS